MPKLQKLSKFKYYDKFDLSNAFWSIPITDPVSQSWLSFHVPGKSFFTWTVLPQGIKVGPSSFQNRIDEVCSELPAEFNIDPFFDDIIYGADTPEELQVIREQFIALIESYGFIINKDKTILGATQIDALGFTISQSSILPRDDYIEQLLQWRTPENICELRKFIGKVGYLRPKTNLVEVR
jgi:hypothetical protein